GTGEWMRRPSRGRAYAGLGLWERAVGDYAEAMAARTKDWGLDFEYALAELAAGHLEEYRHACVRWLERLDETTDPETVASVAWACALAAEMVPDLGSVLKLAGAAAAGDPDKYPCGRTSGALLSRPGKVGAGVKCLHRAPPLQDAPEVWPLLAMAHPRRGHAEEARQWLQNAQLWIDKGIKEKTAQG